VPRERQVRSPPAHSQCWNYGIEPASFHGSRERRFRAPENRTCSRVKPGNRRGGRERRKGTQKRRESFDHRPDIKRTTAQAAKIDSRFGKKNVLFAQEERTTERPPTTLGDELTPARCSPGTAPIGPREFTPPPGRSSGKTGIERDPRRTRGNSRRAHRLAEHQNSRCLGKVGRSIKSSSVRRGVLFQLADFPRAAKTAPREKEQILQQATSPSPRNDTIRLPNPRRIWADVADPILQTSRTSFWAAVLDQHGREAPDPSPAPRGSKERKWDKLPAGQP